jgi:undecaprenyl diphosphate synthase
MRDSRPKDTPDGGSVPRHVAVIMDGNGRWAAARHLPRSAGHRAGLKPVRLSVEACTRRGCQALTLFAFSSENWARPAPEVGLLMRLFLEAIDQEIDELASQGVRVRFIGDRTGLAAELVSRIVAAEARTRTNERLTLCIALAYGGRWDLVQATRALAAQCQRGELESQAIDESQLASALALGDLPDPDLFIRTGGERRISNFLLWNLAYTELWFTDVLWPDFDERELDAAFNFYAGRERRYGRVGTAAEPA